MVGSKGRLLPPASAAAASGLAVVLLTAALLSILRSAATGLYDLDGYYHIRYAEILGSRGIFRTFPWWQETFLRERWADKDFLYHVLLIPFTWGDLLTGAKVAAIAFGTALAAVFHQVVRRLNVPGPSVWTLLMLGASTSVLYRLDFTRPGTLAVTLALAGTLAVFADRPGWAAVIAAGYANSHISYHLLPCIALLHDIHRNREAGSPRSRRTALWTLVGTLAGVLLSPYLPNNLTLFWVQNFQVLGFAWNRGIDLGQGWEMLPSSSRDLVVWEAGALLALFYGAYRIARTGRSSPESRSLLVICAGFLALTLMSRRFIEFLSPFSVLFAAVSFRDSAGPSSVTRRGRRLRAVAVGAALLALAAWNVLGAWRTIADENPPDYGPAATWIRENVPAAETVFHTGWDDFPQLFFHAPDQHYLVGLDPAFFYVTDPTRWKLWDDVWAGKVEDPFAVVRRQFRARWAIATRNDPGLTRAASLDPRFLERFRDGAASVFELRDDGRVPTEWQIRGWWPDPRRTLLEVPLGFEPGGESSGGPPPWGVASSGIVVENGGVLDLAKRAGLPSSVRDACVTARTEVTPASPGLATLAIATDDAVRVWLNGRLVVEVSPFRHPPAGTPGGPPLNLEDVLRPGPGVPEHRVEVKLSDRPNDIVVKSCRVGDDLAFLLRTWEGARR